MTASDVIERLKLEPHPEGGWFRETWRADAKDGARASGTAIYYLLKAGERSHWHRVDAAEIWHYYAGAPLKLSISEAGNSQKELILGPDLSKGEAPQLIVPPHAWQAAESVGPYTLVGCTVSPAFEFAGFEMAPENWAPEN
ncbi:cupin domain-containing protein [Hyphococcus sp.]|uniref:cupin domain-containing protein n=1 Tax=Hyphococcus sp. TaxID=2038636 RepID=UPI0035C766A8